LLFALLVVWVADSAAYFVGRAWGEHKMAPLISPHKSWEGYVAGVLSGVLLGLVANFLLPFSLWRGVGLGALLALLTPLGDLFISLMKRQMGVKDTSHLIPGHGGVLDRVDSVLWAGTLTWLFVTLSIS
jgi:phosphatidate cytidylyltransferase